MWLVCAPGCFFLKIVYHISCLCCSLVVQRLFPAKCKHSNSPLEIGLNLLFIVLRLVSINSLSRTNMCLHFLIHKNSYWLNNPRKACVTILCYSSDSRFRGHNKNIAYLARCSIVLGSERKPIDSFMSPYKCAEVFIVVWFLSSSSLSGRSWPDKSVTFVRFRNWEPDNIFFLLLSCQCLDLWTVFRPQSGRIPLC